MRRNSLRAFAYHCASGVQMFAVAATAGIGAAFKADPEKWREPLIADTLQWMQENAWWMLLTAAVAAIVAKGIAAWAGPPWAWKSINKLLNFLREQVFDAAPGDAIHDHRATLFRRRRNVVWIWPWRCRWCPWGPWRAPWSGWLVPVARSGHTTQRTNVIYLAPDDAANVEGVAGEAWRRNDVVVVVDLPSLTANSTEKEIAEYAQRTFVSEAWVKRRIKLGKPCPQSLCGIPVEVDNRNWGAIVLDSCRPQGIRHRAHNWDANLKLVPLALREFLERA